MSKRVSERVDWFIYIRFSIIRTLSLHCALSMQSFFYMRVSFAVVVVVVSFFFLLLHHHFTWLASSLFFRFGLCVVFLYAACECTSPSFLSFFQVSSSCYALFFFLSVCARCVSYVYQCQWLKFTSASGLQQTTGKKEEEQRKNTIITTTTITAATTVTEP